MGYKIAGEAQAHRDLMKVSAESDFSGSILRLFQELRPQKLIETGTFLGTGTTAIIASSLQRCGISDAQFFSIEVNPYHFAAAVQNLNAMNLRVHLLHGLSVPRAMLPLPQQIHKDMIETQVDGIFVDHSEAERMQRYFAETNFPGVQDDLLGKCLAHFDYQPDFVLLDSAGHLGQVEFNYTVQLLRSRCVIALDDTNHVKHYKSLESMKRDPRFNILTQSTEKFGFCIAAFTP